MMLAVAVSSVAPPPRAGVAPRAPELDAFTLKRAQQGQAAACRGLVVRYQRPVFAVLSRMLGHGPHVEDLAQETFLRVFKALPGFDPHGPAQLSTWILTVASRLAIDELRKRRPELVALDHLDTLPGTLEADAPVHQREASNALHAALESLGPAFRATVVLSAFHELSHDEIARVTGVDVGTVKSRLHRARAALRAALQPKPAEQP